MTIYGLLCGLKDYTNIADFMKLKEDYFTKLLGLENGTPSHDCLSDVVGAIDSKKFMEIFIEWTKEIVKNKTGKHISIDGNAIKSATDKINKEIQDIADRLTESTNGTYQWLKFNLTRDMKSIDMYFEIVE